MANRTLRLYTCIAAVVLFLAVWVTIASRPWLSDTSASAPQSASPAAEPSSTQLRDQQQRVSAKAAELERLLASLQRAPAQSRVVPSAPAPHIVQTPPVTRSRSS